jgi:hypothetical protein
MDNLKIILNGLHGARDPYEKIGLAASISGCAWAPRLSSRATAELQNDMDTYMDLTCLSDCS